MNAVHHTSDSAVQSNHEAVEAGMRSALNFTGGWPVSLQEAVEYHLDSGGHRARARLAYFAASKLGLPPVTRVSLAASVELLHNASLVQDDLQDRSEDRRGRPAVWRRYGEDTALALIDLLIASSFNALATVETPDVLVKLIQRVHQAIGLTVKGQQADVSSGAHDHDLESVLQLAGEKSGPLFALGLELPLLAARLDGFLGEAHQAARAFGTGYQIIDDLLDRESDRAAGNGSNVVLLLERQAPPAIAAVKAQTLAESFLENAVDLGASLPNACGAILADFTALLQQRLSHQISA